MKIDIYGQNGTLKLTAPDGSGGQCVEQLQGDSELTLSFDYYEYVELKVNDYADFLGRRYWLLEQYRPKEEGSRHWHYDLKLYGTESLLKRYLVVEHTDGDANPVFTLTAPASQHVRMIVECLQRATGWEDWSVGDVTVTGNITIDYFGKYCDEALRELAEQAGTEYWTEGRTVHLCRCLYGSVVEMGYGRGLTTLERDTADNAKFYTRLYPVGSQRNINPETYGHLRLQLPDGSKYVDLDTATYGVIDHYEQDAFAGIFPRYTGTVGSVRVEDRVDEDGTPFKVYFFTDAGLTFDPNDHLLPGEKLRVSFQTGELQGLGETDDHYFEADYNSETGEYEIMNIWTDGEQLPTGSLIPAAGDQYIPWNISMPESYVRAAEQEFKTAVDNYNQNHFVDISVYRGTTDHVWVEGGKAEGVASVDLYVGRPVRLLSTEYFPGTGYRDSRITKITRRVDVPTQMTVEISDAVSTGTLTKINDTLKGVRAYSDVLQEGLSNAGRLNRRNTWTAENIFNALVYLRRGMVFGGDNNGSQGLWVDAEGNASMTIGALKVLGTLDVEEIVVNQVRHTGGLFVNSRANLVVSAVDGNRLYFNTTDGNGQTIWNLFEKGDLALSMTFNLKSQTGNIIRYYWREVTAVGADYIELGEGVTNTEPVVGDSVVQIGHASDRARQGIQVMGFSEENGPFFAEYDGISKPTVPDFDNYAKARIYLSPKRNKIEGTFVSETYGDIDELVQTLSATLQDVKAQADHQLNVWYGDYVPLTDNLPASAWITDEEKALHVDDIFYNTAETLADGKGRAYQWQDPHGDRSYQWVEITDRDTLAALEAAGLAQQTADGKRRVFSTSANTLPEPPYDKDDLWVDATYTLNDMNYQKDILHCVTPRATGSTPSISDWAPATAATHAYLENLGNEIALGVTEGRTYTDNAIALAKQAIDNQIASVEQAVSANAGYIGDLRDSVEGLGNDFSAMSLRMDSIGAVVNKVKFDANGNITNINTSGLVLTSQFATLFAQSLTTDAVKNVLGISKSGIVVTDGSGTMYSQYKDASGNTTTASIGTVVTYDAKTGQMMSGVNIYADQIKLQAGVSSVLDDYAKKSDIAVDWEQGGLETAAAGTAYGDRMKSANAYSVRTKSLLPIDGSVRFMLNAGWQIVVYYFNSGKGYISMQNAQQPVSGVVKPTLPDGAAYCAVALSRTTRIALTPQQVPASGFLMTTTSLATKAEISMFVSKNEEGYLESGIKMTADQIDFVTNGFTIKNTDGVKTIVVDRNGDLTVSGTIKGGSLTDTLTVGSGTNKMYIRPNNAGGADLVGMKGDTEAIRLGFDDSGYAALIISDTTASFPGHMMLSGAYLSIAPAVHSLGFGIYFSNSDGTMRLGSMYGQGSMVIWPRSRESVTVGQVYVDSDGYLKVRTS